MPRLPVICTASWDCPTPGPSELDGAHRLELPHGLPRHQLVGHLTGAAGGLGIAIAAVVEGEAAHQVGLHHRKLVVAHGALDVLGIQLLHINRQQPPARVVVQAFTEP